VAGLLCLLAAGFAYTGVTRADADAAENTATPRQLFQRMSPGNRRSVAFSSGNWAYYVETPSAERAIVLAKELPSGGTVSDPEVLFRKAAGASSADLMILGCGESFGDDDCDFYSPLGKPPLSGKAIKESPRVQERYLWILKAAIDHAARRP